MDCSSNICQGSSNGTVPYQNLFGTIDINKEEIKAGHEHLNKLREEIKGFEQDERDAKDSTLECTKSIQFSKDAFVKHDSGMCLRALKTSAVEIICGQLEEAAENKAAEVRRARRCLGSMTSALLEEDVAFACSWNCAPVGREKRKQEVAKIVEETRTEQEMVEKEVSEFAANELEYRKASAQLTEMQELVSSESEALEGILNDLEPQLACLKETVKQKESVYINLQRKYSATTSELRSRMETKKKYLLRVHDDNSRLEHMMVRKSSTVSSPYRHIDVIDISDESSGNGREGNSSGVGRSLFQYSISQPFIYQDPYLASPAFAIRSPVPGGTSGSPILSQSGPSGGRVMKDATAENYFMVPQGRVSQLPLTSPQSLGRPVATATISSVSEKRSVDVRSAAGNVRKRFTFKKPATSVTEVANDDNSVLNLSKRN